MLVFRLSSADWRSGRVGEAGIAHLENNNGRNLGGHFVKAGLEGRMRHLLIVEDSALLAMDVELAAEDLGLERVSVAPDAGKALQLLETESIDAALVDLFLGSEDSRPVTERLSARGIPFAVMTGTSDLEWLEAQLPGVPILTKPFTSGQLAETLERLC